MLCCKRERDEVDSEVAFFFSIRPHFSSPKLHIGLGWNLVLTIYINRVTRVELLFMSVGYNPVYHRI
jgi:hypothetical protein